jgi:hypothetical protein
MQLHFRSTPVSKPNALQCDRCRLGELQAEPTRPKISTKPLPKQHLDVRLVIDHENKKVHALPPDLASGAAIAGE